MPARARCRIARVQEDPTTVTRVPSDRGRSYQRRHPGRAIRARSLPVLVAAALVLLGAACGGDGGDVTGAGAEIGGETAAGSTDASGDGATTSTEALPLPTPAPTADGPTTSAGGSSTTTGSNSADAASSTPATAGGGKRPPTGLDCTTACNLVFEGDSLFHSFLETICTELGTLSCVNSGTVGNRVDQMVETARLDVDIHVGSGTNDVLVLWAGTNDLWQQFHSADPNENARQTYGWISTYVAERRANGWDYILVMTLPPANPNVIQGDDTLNELIRANAAGADAIVDLAAEPKLANPFDPVLKAADGVHYTDPGRWLVLFDHLAPAIRRLAPS